MKFCERPYRYIYTDGYGEQGTVLMCQWMKNSPARVIGNLLHEDLYDIWHGEKAEKLRRSFEDQSFCYCEKMSCPYLENDSLPDISEEEFKKRAVPLEYPDYFNIAHDLTCNHKCPSCRYEIFRPNEEYIDNIRQINSRLLPFLNKAKVISGDGLGDLFSSPYMMELFERIKPEQNGTKISIETNGVFCDEAHWERLSELCRLADISLQITPNSYDRSTYKYLSGGLDDLDKVIHNLSFLKRLRAEGIIKLFNITIVVQDSNFRELPEFVKRSLEDFEANSVVIRTIYKWNKLSAEDYWFKDVMNPLHPYHRDMLEVMKDPILKDPKVYNWTNFNEHPKSLHPAYRYKDYMEMMKLIIVDELSGQGLAQRLEDMHVNTVVIYGDNDLAEMMIQMLVKSRIVDETYPKLRCCVARDTCRTSIQGLNVVPLKEYKPDERDLILISNFMDKEFVERDLRALGFTGQMIAVDELYHSSPR